MERVADPSTVAALLSLVLVVRNKLSGIGLSTVGIIGSIQLTKGFDVTLLYSLYRRIHSSIPTF